MSKVANMLNMVQILKDGKVHSLQSLSKELEISIRMIRQYKIELEQAGIYISSSTGKYGGYILEEELNQIDIGLTEQEINLLEKIAKDVEKRKEQEVLIKIQEAYHKNKMQVNKRKLQKIQEYDQKMTEIYKQVRKAINERRKMKITFFSVNSGITTRIIHPAELFEYIDQWYVAGFCELRNEIRMFKLEDIKEYTLLDENYTQKFTIKKKL